MLNLNFEIMKNIVIVLLFVVYGAGDIFAGGYEVGDKASDFKLKNIDDKLVSLKDYSEAKGFVVVFTCNTCPVSKAYEDRIIELDEKYSEKGYPVVAINPNDPDVSPGDSFENMKKRAKDKDYGFPYLFDETQEVYQMYGATKTPHVYVLEKNDGDLIVSYIGTIDDNSRNASEVKEFYLANALDALIEGDSPEPNFTKAVGCSIKAKK